MRLLRSVIVGLIIIVAAGCERQETPSPSEPVSTSTALPSVETTPTLTALNRGAKLFQEHCAQCHGPEAQGHPDWQTPGVVAAPPLNGTGTDVKRTRAQFAAIIRDGAKRGGTPVMPSWKGRLSDAEIDDIIAWFQALWPAEAYAKWQRGPGASASR